MKKLLFTLAALLATGFAASAAVVNLSFSEQEVTLGAGETKVLHLVLDGIERDVVAAGQIQFVMYGSNGEITTDVELAQVYARNRLWFDAEGASLPAYNTGNSLSQSHPFDGVWRIMWANTSFNEVWYAEDCAGNVAEFTLKVADDWADDYATLKMVTTAAGETGSDTPFECIFEIVNEGPWLVDYVPTLKINNANATPEEKDFTGEIIFGDMDANGNVPVSYSGDEEVTLVVTVDGTEVEVVDGMFNLGSYGDHTVVVTISADGYKTESRTKIFTWEEPAPEPTDAPVLTWDEETLTVTATGEGEVKLYVDGVEVENPYTFEQGDEDVTYVVTATAQGDGKELSETTTLTVVVPAKAVEPEVTPEPEIVITETDDAIIIDAVGEGEIHVYVNGEEVDLPCTITKGDEEQVIVVTATAQGDGKEVSPTVTQEVVVPAKGNTPEDPHATGYWVVSIDKDGNEVWEQMTIGSDVDGYQTSVAYTYSVYGGFDIEGGEERPFVSFYVVVDGVVYGPEADATEPVYGDAMQNPLFEGENLWNVLVGYKYVIGVVTDVETGDKFLQISRGGFVGIDEMNADKAVAGVRYFNMAGQEMQQASGMTIVVTTYTDGTTSAVKVMK